MQFIFSGFFTGCFFHYEFEIMTSLYSVYYPYNNVFTILQLPCAFQYNSVCEDERSLRAPVNAIDSSHQVPYIDRIVVAQSDLWLLVAKI